MTSFDRRRSSVRESAGKGRGERSDLRAGDSNDGVDSKPGSDRSRDDEAVAELVAEFGPQLTRLAWAILRDWALAEDAVQEGFTLFAAKIDQIELERRRGWLVRCVQLKAHNLRRKFRRMKTGVGDSFLRQEVESTGSAINRLELLEQAEKIRTLIRELPEEQQEVIRMRLVEGKQFSEIAESSQIPLGTVLSRMRLALQKLRAEWIQGEG